MHMGYPRLANNTFMGYPFGMRNPKQIEAEQRYAPKRAKRPVSFRLDADEMADLDRVRGAHSRSDYVLNLVRKALGRA